MVISFSNANITGRIFDYFPAGHWQTSHARLILVLPLLFQSSQMAFFIYSDIFIFISDFIKIFSPGRQGPIRFYDEEAKFTTSLFLHDADNIHAASFSIFSRRMQIVAYYCVWFIYTYMSSLLSFQLFFIIISISIEYCWACFHFKNHTASPRQFPLASAESPSNSMEYTHDITAYKKFLWPASRACWLFRFSLEFSSSLISSTAGLSWLSCYHIQSYIFIWVFIFLYILYFCLHHLTSFQLFKMARCTASLMPLLRPLCHFTKYHYDIQPHSQK